MIEVNGIAHIFLTVSDFEACFRFYDRLLPALGMKPVMRVEGSILYCVGGRTAVGIQPCDEGYRGQKFAQGRSGLHHVCFRARTREDVDAVHRVVVDLGAKVVHAPEEGVWAPGYYSVLFEDPDGIRLEVNFVPGKGLLTP